MVWFDASIEIVTYDRFPFVFLRFTHEFLIN